MSLAFRRIGVDREYGCRKLHSPKGHMSDPSVEAVIDSRRPPFLILVAVSAIGPLALNIFMPSMPGLQATFHVSYGTVQQIGRAHV